MAATTHKCQGATKGVFTHYLRLQSAGKGICGGISPRVILAPGRQLAELMIDTGVGVTVEQTYEVKRLDLAYITEDKSGTEVTDSVTVASSDQPE